MNKKPRKSRIKKEIEERLGKPFRQIIEEHFTPGLGRYSAAQKLETLCEQHRKPEEQKLRIVHSTLWYIIKTGIETGEFCEVEGDPTTPPIFNFNHNRKKYKKNKDEVYYEIEQNWSCTICGNKWKELQKVKDLELMCVRGKSCPDCNKKGINSFGKIQLEFEFNGIRAKKSIGLVNGRIREVFIDETETPCESPFSDLKKVKSSEE